MTSRGAETLKVPVQGVDHRIRVAFLLPVGENYALLYAATLCALHDISGRSAGHTFMTQYRVNTR